MKRFISIFLILFLIIPISAGCRAKDSVESVGEDTGNTDKLSIVATIFPSYDFARQIAGDKADVTMLLAPGAESHSFEPTPQDIIMIQNCDVFLYVGGENDTWVDSILDSIDQTNMNVVRLLDCVRPLGEEIKEGMEHEDHDADGHEHDSDVHEDHDSDSHVAGVDEVEYDEHVWTSPQNVIAIANVIKDVLCRADSSNAEVYQANAAEYIGRLDQLDKEFKAVVNKANRKTIVFGDRFPLRYFTEAYGLDYWAAFPGCSSETEPSAATIAFLINKVKEERIPVIFKIELSSGNVAQSVAEAAGARVLTFNSCHNLTKKEYEDGATYLSLMRENVKVLEEALN